MLYTKILEWSTGILMTRDAKAIMLLWADLAPNYLYALFDQCKLIFFCIKIDLLWFYWLLSPMNKVVFIPWSDARP